jgi:pimeloyl-ACP methyl ester carboxylesterase
MKLPMIGVFTLLLGMFCVPLSHAQESIDGDWVGGTNLFNNPVFIHVRFTSNASGISGLANVQPWKVGNRPLSVVNVEGTRVHFEFPSVTGVPYQGEGDLKDGVIQGKMWRGNTEGKLHLVHVAKADRRLFDEYVGAYELPNPKQAGRKTLHLVTYGALGFLRWVNLETGETTALYPMSNNKFFFGFSVVQKPSPDFATWTFEKGEKGEIASTVRVQGQPDQHPTKTSLYKQEQLTLRNGDVTLRATLLSPGTEGKHPAVVYIPGSGGDYTSRDSSLFREYHQLISNGIAVLIYDKRGTGGSSGDWHRSSFEDLGRDALAGVASLKSRKDINPKQIGVWGFSQGATIAPFAASVSKDVAFVIMMSGGGISGAEAEKGQQVAAMRARNLSEDEIKEALAFMELQFDAVRSKAGWEKFQAAIPAARDKRWFQHTWGGTPKDHWLWGWWQFVINHDPATVLEKVRVPVLAMWGSGDTLTVPEYIREMVAKIEESLKKGGNKDVTIKIFPGAEHDLTVKGSNEQVPTPGFHDLLVGWLRQRVTVKQQKASIQ